MVKLREIAHSRTGDKGNTSNISVIAYDAKHYPLLLAQVTSERVKAHFAGVVEGEVVRYELPNIAALNFVMSQALGGGVTRSLALDAHGKSLSSALLDLEIEDEHDFDEAEDNIVQDPSGHFRVKAVTEIADFNERLGAELSDADYDTIGGLVLNKFGRLPKRTPHHR